MTTKRKVNVWEITETQVADESYFQGISDVQITGNCPDIEDFTFLMQQTGGESIPQPEFQKLNVEK